MQLKNDKRDVVADIILVQTCTLRLLLHYSDLRSPVLHCVYTLPTNGQFFSQTEQKQANGTDPVTKQPHSRSGITL